MKEGIITIAEYEPHYQLYFEKFNRRWIEEYFEMEPVDEFVLTQPEAAIIAPGGAILMALYNGVPAGTVALRKLEEGIYEFTKMAVDIKFQRKGIAEALCYASFEKARQLGATTVILFSNSTLKPALALYEKVGFRHLPVGMGEYKRSDVKMTYSLLPVLNETI